MEEKKILNNITDMVFILDRSGSMYGMEEDTIGGFNSLIEKQKALEGEAFVSTYLFDDNIEKLHDRVNLQEIEPLTDKQYYVRGTTALLDCIGIAINNLDNSRRGKYAKEIPSHTVFLITTDGMENASREFTSDNVKEMIKEHEKQGWEFVFIAANIDAVETAGNIGIRKERAVNYKQSEKGTRSVYDAMDNIVEFVRMDKKISEDWKDRIYND